MSLSVTKSIKVLVNRLIVGIVRAQFGKVKMYGFRSGEVSGEVDNRCLMARQIPNAEKPIGRHRCKVGEAL